jgi:4-amino-4-deoxy-L-arabinose transferase-like glycosyltransferase
MRLASAIGCDRIPRDVFLMTNRRKNLPFWILTVAVALAPTLPRLVSEGTFLDGLLYSVMSRNLAEGVGSFWRPYLTATLTPEYFTDHPPFGIVLESLFFRAFGDHLWVESLYSLCAAVAAGVIVVLLWRRLTRESPGLSGLSWLPVFLWATVPLVSWSYANNMLENTLTVFVLGAVYFAVASVDDRRWALAVVLAGACMWAGLFTKGVLALFPLAVWPFAWMVLRRPRASATVARVALALAVVAALTGAVLLGAVARESTLRYLHSQFLPSLAGERGVVPNRFGVVDKLFSELAPMLGVALVVSVVAWWRSRRRGAATSGGGAAGPAWLMIIVGLCGSLPLVASPRQSGFYLVPAFPFFDAIDARGVGLRAFRWTAVVALCAVLVYSAGQAGKVGRNRATIEDVKRIGATVGEGATVGVCPAMSRDWTLQGYFARYYRVTLDPHPTEHQFVVLGKDRCPSVDLGDYRPVSLPTHSLFLVRRR